MGHAEGLRREVNRAFVAAGFAGGHQAHLHPGLDFAEQHALAIKPGQPLGSNSLGSPPVTGTS